MRRLVLCLPIILAATCSAPAEPQGLTTIAQGGYGGSPPSGTSIATPFHPVLAYGQVGTSTITWAASIPALGSRRRNLENPLMRKQLGLLRRQLGLLDHERGVAVLIAVGRNHEVPATT